MLKTTFTCEHNRFDLKPILLVKVQPLYQFIYIKGTNSYSNKFVCVKSMFTRALENAL